MATPNGSATAPAIVTGVTSRQLHCGMARIETGKLEIESMRSKVAAAICGLYTAETSGM
jgi:hypothetical protein